MGHLAYCFFTSGFVELVVRGAYKRPRSAVWRRGGLKGVRVSEGAGLPRRGLRLAITLAAAACLALLLGGGAVSMVGFSNAPTVTVTAGPQAVRFDLNGCFASELAANDDGSTGAVPVPFTGDFFGLEFSTVYVNNNGNVTLNGPLSTFTPFGLLSTSQPIIAPFFADVDTRNAGSDVVTYGATTL